MQLVSWINVSHQWAKIIFNISSFKRQQTWRRLGHGNWSFNYGGIDNVLGSHLSPIHGRIPMPRRTWLEQSLHAHVQVRPKWSVLNEKFFDSCSSLLGGSESHKSIKKDGNVVLRLYYTSRAVLFWVCAFNELFYILLYCQYYGSFTKVNLAGQVINLTQVLLAVSAPIWALKQIINVIQMVGAAKHLASLDVNPSSRKKN